MFGGGAVGRGLKDVVFVNSDDDDDDDDDADDDDDDCISIGIGIGSSEIIGDAEYGGCGCGCGCCTGRTIVGTTGNPSKPVFVNISPLCSVAAT
jgi:hypothetical protein